MADEKLDKENKAPKKAAAPKKATVSKVSNEKIESTKIVKAKDVTTKKVASNKPTVRVTLVKSFYGRLPKHRATVTGLGLKRINHTVVLEDTPAVRGMINKVSYLLKVEG